METRINPDVDHREFTIDEIDARRYPYGTQVAWDKCARLDKFAPDLDKAFNENQTPQSLGLTSRAEYDAMVSLSKHYQDTAGNGQSPTANAKEIEDHAFIVKTFLQSIRAQQNGELSPNLAKFVENDPSLQELLDSRRFNGDFLTVAMQQLKASFDDSDNGGSDLTPEQIKSLQTHGFMDETARLKLAEIVRDAGLAKLLETDALKLNKETFITPSDGEPLAVFPKSSTEASEINSQRVFPFVGTVQDDPKYPDGRYVGEVLWKAGSAQGDSWTMRYHWKTPEEGGPPLVRDPSAQAADLSYRTASPGVLWTKVEIDPSVEQPALDAGARVTPRFQFEELMSPSVKLPLPIPVVPSQPLGDTELSLHKKIEDWMSLYFGPGESVDGTQVNTVRWVQAERMKNFFQIQGKTRLSEMTEDAITEGRIANQAQAEAFIESAAKRLLKKNFLKKIFGY